MLYVSLLNIKGCFFLHPIKATALPFSLIHSDVWEPSTVPNIFGAQWFIIFVDDCIRVVWLYLLKTKSMVGKVFPMFYNMVKNQFRVEIKRFRFHIAKDFCNQTLYVFKLGQFSQAYVGKSF